MPVGWGGYLVEFSYDVQKQDENNNNKLESELEKVVENELSIKEQQILNLMLLNPKITQRELRKKLE